ncbi:MAG: hypothetical protein AB7N76_11085 [Planctomycetota bacterium]
MSEPPISIVIAAPAACDALAASFESARRQVEGAQLIVAGPAAAAERLAGFSGEFEVVEADDAAPGELRNRALARARAARVVVLDPGERLGEGALGRHLEALAAEPHLVGSYGRTAVQEGGRTRVRPDHGKGGTLLRRLLKERHLVASSAALVWRRDALGARPFGDYRSGQALRLALALDLARGERELAFQPEVVAQREAEAAELGTLEELVRVLVGVVYGAEALDERIELAARRRLARHLVAIGKHHYREGAYARAGKFFDEAVKAAPADFRGRRYQFLNFVKNTLTRE